MKVSKATAYALHAMLYMVRHRTQLPVSSETVAKAEGIPPGYLAKIFQKLAKAGFLKSMRGAKRGYDFARPPETINLLEVFEAIEGHPIFEECLLKYCDCGGTPLSCHIYGQWYSATQKIKKILEETNLDAATWSHPEHRFNEIAAVDDSRK